MILNGAQAITANVSAPGLENDGDMLIIVSSTKLAHIVNVVTGTGLGGGGGAVDGLTFAAGAQQCVALIAANGAWVPFPSVLAGTLTNITLTAA